MLGASAWVGGVTFTHAHAAWVNRRQNPAEFMHFLDVQAALGMRYFAPLAVVVLAAGIAMVIQSGWNFTDAWILIGLALWAVAVGTGALYLGPQVEKVRVGLAGGGPPDTEIQRRIEGIQRASSLDLVVLVLVVADMVIKPGA